MIASHSLSLSDFVLTYERHHPDLSSGACLQLKVAVRLLESYAEQPVALTDLGRDLIAGWMRWLTVSRSPATVNSKRQAIVTLWRYAAELELVAPPPRIPKLREPSRLPVVWSLEDIGRLLAICDRWPGQWEGTPAGQCWRIAVLVIWDTGCRIGEVLGARVDDVDLDAQLWQVPAEHTKGRRSDRLYRLHEDTIETIRKSMPPPRERLFPFPWRRRQVWPEFRRILTVAGLPSGRRRMFHCLRRTAESYAAAARGVEFAAEAVGHTVAVARKSYISPTIAPGPCLVDAVPRPK